MGRSIGNLTNKTSLADIARWIPAQDDDSRLLNFLHNKALYPWTIPATETELHMEQAAAREILRQAVEDYQVNQNGQHAPLRLVIARGSIFTTSPRYNQALLILLDALQLTGIFAVAVDTYGILPALGVLAAQEPLAAVQALEGGVLANLGWVVVPQGKGQPDQNGHECRQRRIAHGTNKH